MAQLSLPVEMTNSQPDTAAARGTSHAVAVWCLFFLRTTAKEHTSMYRRQSTRNPDDEVLFDFRCRHCCAQYCAAGLRGRKSPAGADGVRVDDLRHGARLGTRGGREVCHRADTRRCRDRQGGKYLHECPDWCLHLFAGWQGDPPFSGRRIRKHP